MLANVLCDARPGDIILATSNTAAVEGGARPLGRERRYKEAKNHFTTAAEIHDHFAGLR